MVLAVTDRLMAELLLSAELSGKVQGEIQHPGISTLRLQDVVFQNGKKEARFRLNPLFYRFCIKQGGEGGRDRVIG